MRTIIKRFVPVLAWEAIRSISKALGIIKLHNYLQYVNIYFHDLNHHFQHDGARKSKSNKQAFKALLIKQCHVIEKGITMPEPRPGFGKQAANTLQSNVLEYINKFHFDEVCTVALGTLQSYIELSEEMGQDVDSLKQKNASIRSRMPSKLGIQRRTGKLKVLKTSYTAAMNMPLEAFVNSRYSVRDFTPEPAHLSKLHKALEISMKTPSNCNSQAWRVHVIMGHQKCSQILSWQNGNRGFGHLVRSLIVVNCDLNAYDGRTQRNLPYVDGGMFAMTLVYGLHSQGLGSCILNLCLEKDSEIAIRKFADIPESEVFIAMIAVGNVHDSFFVAESHRKSFSEILHMV